MSLFPRILRFFRIRKINKKAVTGHIFQPEMAKCLVEILKIMQIVKSERNVNTLRIEPAILW